MHAANNIFSCKWQINYDSSDDPNWREYVDFLGNLNVINPYFGHYVKERISKNLVLRTAPLRINDY
jgi:hypothetical protein